MDIEGSFDNQILHWLKSWKIPEVRAGILQDMPDFASDLMDRIPFREDCVLKKYPQAFNQATLKNGVYRMFWVDGGLSVASVGRNTDGKAWFAPANWVSGICYNWSMVKHVELIELSK